LRMGGIVDRASRRRGHQAYFMGKPDGDAVNRGCTRFATASQRPRTVNIAVPIDIFLDKLSGAIAVRSLCEASSTD
jgi:hypothetical protein